MNVKGLPAIARVDFLRVPRTEVSEKICISDDITEFSICTIASAATL